MSYLGGCLRAASVAPRKYSRLGRVRVARSRYSLFAHSLACAASATGGAWLAPSRAGVPAQSSNLDIDGKTKDHPIGWSFLLAFSPCIGREPGNRCTFFEICTKHKRLPLTALRSEASIQQGEHRPVLSPTPPATFRGSHLAVPSGGRNKGSNLLGQPKRKDLTFGRFLSRSESDGV